MAIAKAPFAFQPTRTRSRRNMWGLWELWELNTLNIFDLEVQHP